MSYGKGVKVLDVVEVGDSATELVGNSSLRQCVYFCNPGSTVVYIGPHASVTHETGIPIAAGEKFTDNYSWDAWWGVTETGTADLIVVDVRQ